MHGNCIILGVILWLLCGSISPFPTASKPKPYTEVPLLLTLGQAGLGGITISLEAREIEKTGKVHVSLLGRYFNCSRSSWVQVLSAVYIPIYLNIL